MTPISRLRYWLHKNVPGYKGWFIYFGQRVYFSKDSLIFYMACDQGIYERDNARLLGALAKTLPEGVCFDVGANIGLMAIPILDACGAVRVVSFEPSPATFKMLSTTVSGSRFSSRWQAVGKAVGNSVGESVFFAAEKGQDAYDGFADTRRSEGAKKVTVPVTTLDAEWEALGKPRVSLIKIDVEGAELKVIDGARGCIAHEKPPILTEWTRLNLDAYKHRAEDLLVAASEIGYGVYSMPELLQVTNLHMLELQMLRTESFLLVSLESSRLWDRNRVR